MTNPATPKINPRRIKIWSQKFTDLPRGEKYYRAGFQIGHFAQYSRAKFRTATEAQDYATRAIMLWTKLTPPQINERFGEGSKAETV